MGQGTRKALEKSGELVTHPEKLSQGQSGQETVRLRRSRWASLGQMTRWQCYLAILHLGMAQRIAVLPWEA